MVELLEIERKRKLDSGAESLVAQLKSCGFTEAGMLHEIDTYYSRPDVDFMKTVECLRIRERDGFAEITYKPASAKSTHTRDDVIIKPETNLPIRTSDTSAAKQLLSNLEMVKLVEVNKRRHAFKSDDYPHTTVAIDEIKGAGVFVEVEVMGHSKEDGLKKLERIEEQLRIAELEVVTKPYRDLCMLADVN